MANAMARAQIEKTDGGVFYYINDCHSKLSGIHESKRLGEKNRRGSKHLSKHDLSLRHRGVFDEPDPAREYEQDPTKAEIDLTPKTGRLVNVEVANMCHKEFFPVVDFQCSGSRQKKNKWGAGISKKEMSDALWEGLTTHGWVYLQDIFIPNNRVALALGQKSYKRHARDLLREWGEPNWEYKSDRRDKKDKNAAQIWVEVKQVSLVNYQPPAGDIAISNRPGPPIICNIRQLLLEAMLRQRPRLLQSVALCFFPETEGNVGWQATRGEPDTMKALYVLLFSDVQHRLNGCLLNAQTPEKPPLSFMQGGFNLADILVACTAFALISDVSTTEHTKRFYRNLSKFVEDETKHRDIDYDDLAGPPIQQAAADHLDTTAQSVAGRISGLPDAPDSAVEDEVQSFTKGLGWMSDLDFDDASTTETVDDSPADPSAAHGPLYDVQSLTEGLGSMSDLDRFLQDPVEVVRDGAWTTESVDDAIPSNPISNDSLMGDSDSLISAYFGGGGYGPYDTMSDEEYNKMKAEYILGGDDTQAKKTRATQPISQPPRKEKSEPDEWEGVPELGDKTPAYLRKFILGEVQSIIKRKPKERERNWDKLRLCFLLSCYNIHEAPASPRDPLLMRIMFPEKDVKNINDKISEIYGIETETILGAVEMAKFQARRFLIRYNSTKTKGPAFHNSFLENLAYGHVPTGPAKKYKNNLGESTFPALSHYRIGDPGWNVEEAKKKPEKLWETQMQPLFTDVKYLTQDVVRFQDGLQ